MIKESIMELANHEPNKLIIVGRKVKMWELEKKDNVILFAGNEARSAHLGAKLDQIRKFLQYG